MEVNEMSAEETSGNELEVNEMSRGKRWDSNRQLQTALITAITIILITGLNTTNLRTIKQVGLGDKRERLQDHC